MRSQFSAEVLHMKKMSPKTIDLLFWIFLSVGSLLGYFGLPSQTNFLFVIGVVMILGALLFRHLFFKCPHCGKRITGTSGGYCPYCNKSLIDE